MKMYIQVWNNKEMVNLLELSDENIYKQIARIYIDKEQKRMSKMKFENKERNKIKITVWYNEEKTHIKNTTMKYIYECEDYEY